MFLAMARAASTRATCYRLNVGAILVEQRNVIAIGYNGSAAGEPHCEGKNCPYFKPEGCQVIHAEANALARAAGVVGRGDKCELYVTHSPCNACVSALLHARVSLVRPIHVAEVYFETPYRDPTPIIRLIDGGVRVLQVLPSGLLVDQKTGEIVDE
jgi:dCMP deaminase